MKLAVYSTKQYDRKYLELVNKDFGFELEFFDFLLTPKTAKMAGISFFMASLLGEYHSIINQAKPHLALFRCKNCQESPCHSP